MVSEEAFDQEREKGHQRWRGGKTPRKVASHGEVEHLVAVQFIIGGGQEMDEQFYHHQANGQDPERFFGHFGHFF